MTATGLPGRSRMQPDHHGEQHVLHPTAHEGPTGPRATVILVGNEKGGTGKSTVAMHVVVGLLRSGFNVSSIDLDSRQATLSRHVANRRAMKERDDADLPMPLHVTFTASDHVSRDEAERADIEAFDALLSELSGTVDFIVIDTPGADTPVARHALSRADKLITPINDSFVDLDLLMEVSGSTHGTGRISLFAEQVWEQRKQRAARDGGSIDWIVMRNRLSSLNARNKVAMFEAVQGLARRIGFRVVPGFSERVIFRELFPLGLTILDLFETEGTGPPTTSRIAARQEVRTLLMALRLRHPGTARQEVA